MKTVLAIDIDKWACLTFAANFQDARVICGDVAEHYETICVAKPDVIIAGVPCQPFSTAGKGLGDKDGRNSWGTLIEAIRRSRPRAFLAENVPGMLNQRHLAYTQSVHQELESLGYRLDVKLLDAVNYGVPQFRKRLWFWGIRKDLNIVHVWPLLTHQWPAEVPGMFGASGLPTAITVGQALGIEGGGIHKSRSKAILRRDHPVGEPCCTVEARAALGGGSVLQYRHSPAMLAKHPPASPAPAVQAKWFKGGAEGLVEVDPRLPRNEPDSLGVTQRSGGNGHGEPGCYTELAEPSPTVSGGGTETGGAEPIRHGPLRVRRLTPDECARLQSCPDDMAWPKGITKTARYRIIGNGWACGMAAALSRALATADPESQTVVDLFCGGGLGALGWHRRYWTHQPRSPR